MSSLLRRIRRFFSIEDAPQVPWGWLRGFAWFLVAWPVLCLIALEYVIGAPWSTLLGIVFVPPLIGLLLLCIDRILTRLIGKALRGAPRVAPSLLRDVANVGFAIPVLFGINLVIVTIAGDDWILTGHPERIAFIGTMIGSSLGPALVLRVTHRLFHGPARQWEHRESWGTGLLGLRFLGYVTLIPTLFAAVIMTDYTAKGKPHFGPHEWMLITSALFVGFRSAMARSPDGWARSASAARLRWLSLWAPWAIAGWAAWTGLGYLFVILPFADGELSLATRIVAGVLTLPIGIGMLGMSLLMVGRGVPAAVGEILRLMRSARQV